MKKDTVHPMIWNFDTSTPSYEYDEHDGYSWRLVNFEDILPWFGDPLFIITRGIEQHLLSVAGIIQRDMNRFRGYVHYYRMERLLWQSTVFICSGILGV